MDVQQLGNYFPHLKKQDDGCQEIRNDEELQYLIEGCPDLSEIWTNGLINEKDELKKLVKSKAHSLKCIEVSREGWPEAEAEM